MTKQKMVLDIAFLIKDIEQTICITTDSHTINLDPICIDENTFKKIFYQNDNFGIDIQNDMELYKYITFQTPWRTVNSRGFSLLDTILHNLEDDFNVTRNCFTTDSLLELSKELTNIKSLCDIPLCNMTSLSWEHIQNRIREKYINSHEENKFEIVELIITIVFKIPLECSLPTHIKFIYKLDVNENWIIN
jgi:hypothetical protein